MATPHKTIISFPHMGNYSAVFEQMFGRLFEDAIVRPAPPITRKTVELGERYSPDFVCSPFKYNLGNYIEALDAGANLLFQTGMGCRYGYYGELQEQILRDMGYRFRFACLSREHSRPLAVYRTLRELGCNLPAHKIAGAIHLAISSIRAMDWIEYWMRENIGFESVSGGCEAVHQDFLSKIKRIENMAQLRAAAAHCQKSLSSVKLEKPPRPLRVGMVGDLYTLMEPSSNFYLEKRLASEGVSVSRAMGVWFLLFGRSNARSLRQSGGYLRYPVGANGVDSVSQSLAYARDGYDGILHIKSFGCIPELNAGPALTALSRREKIPILSLSFDTHTGEIGVQTRLEAFTDMLKMKHQKKETS